MAVAIIAGSAWWINSDTIATPASDFTTDPATTSTITDPHALRLSAGVYRLSMPVISGWHARAARLTAPSGCESYRLTGLTISSGKDPLDIAIAQLRLVNQQYSFTAVHARRVVSDTATKPHHTLDATLLIQLNGQRDVVVLTLPKMFASPEFIVVLATRHADQSCSSTTATGDGESLLQMLETLSVTSRSAATI
jgi:hypothetical protein